MASNKNLIHDNEVYNYNALESNVTTNIKISSCVISIQHSLLCVLKIIFLTIVF